MKRVGTDNAIQCEEIFVEDMEKLTEVAELSQY